MNNTVYYYHTPEMFDDFEKPDFSKYSGKLIVWGAGRIGGMAAHCLKKRGVEIFTFCDIAQDKWGTEFCGVPVISPEQMMKQYPNAPVLISNVFHSVVYDELKAKGYENVFDCTSLFLQIDFDGYDFWMLPEYAVRNVEQYMAAVYEQVKKGDEIDQVYLNITTKCTLRCRDCSTFMPYVDNPCIYDSKVIMKDFYNLLDCLGHTRIVNFYGGEPMLHPDLPKMIGELREEKRIDRITIITNATIEPSEELISVLKQDSRVLIRISDYGELSSKVEKIVTTFSDNDIAYEVANYTYWDRPSEIAPSNDTEEELVSKFRACVACNVLFLLNRKAYLCSTSSAVCNIGGFPVSESNYVDMEKHEDCLSRLKECVTDFIGRKKRGQYIDACKYCSGMHCIHFADKVPVAVQTKEKMKFMKL